MAATQRELAIALDAGPDSDADECASLTRRLRVELLDLDVESVELVTGGPAPDGAKAAELLTVGGLAVVLGLQRHLVRAVVDTVVAWLARQQARSVKLTLDGDTLEVTGLSTEEQAVLVERWVARHAPPG